MDPVYVRPAGLNNGNKPLTVRLYKVGGGDDERHAIIGAMVVIVERK